MLAVSIRNDLAVRFIEFYHVSVSKMIAFLWLLKIMTIWLKKL